MNLDDVMSSPNIAEDMDKESLDMIAKDVIDGFEKDKESRYEWERQTNKALELAQLKKEIKNTPWANASNVKYPLISTAALQFAARTYPEIIRNGKVVEIAAIGKDEDGSKEQRAKRISTHMSWQLLVQNNEYEENMDKLLHTLPVVGTVFKKTYFDPVKQRNISELCLHDEIYIHNDTKKLDEASRVTHLLCLSKNDIMSMIRSGVYLDVSKDRDAKKILTSDPNKERIDILEQHRYLDLDGDGYEEPYIVTVAREESKVLRIVARWDEESIDYNEEDEIIRIRPVEHFTDYHFIHSFDGTYYSLGFGHLLLAINDSINTNFNQLLDAGALANLRSGFMGRGVRMKGGQIKLRPGQWHKLESAGMDDIRKQILPLEYKEPSAVLFQLLGLLIDSGKELSSINDAMTGQEQAQNVPATTILALIEQGTKIYNSIRRRLYRAMKKEFEKLYRLNRIFLDPQEYALVLDDPEAVFENDYEDQSLDVHPVADPAMSSDAHRLARSQAQMQLVGQPGINNHEVFRRYLEDLNTPNLEKILPPPDPNAPPPPELIKLMAEIEQKEAESAIKAQKNELQARDVAVREQKAIYENLKTLMEAFKAAEEGEAVFPGVQLQQFKGQLDIMKQNLDQEKQKLEAQKIQKDIQVAQMKAQQQQQQGQASPVNVSSKTE